jgi:ABC-type Fe3+ transport system substrate-binding protein
MLCKRSKQEELQPVVDFFASKEVGEILAHNGLFPSINPEVDNRLEQGNRFMWLGWDYIYANDIGPLIGKCESIFNRAMES